MTSFYFLRRQIKEMELHNKEMYYWMYVRIKKSKKDCTSRSNVELASNTIRESFNYKHEWLDIA